MDEKDTTRKTSNSESSAEHATDPEPQTAFVTEDGVPVASGEQPTRWLNSGIIGVGASSFFSDSGHELVTSLLPSFLTTTLHSGPAALGAIEGVSDALVGLSKLAGGPLSNEPSRRVKVASGGYLLTAAATALIGVCTAVWQVAGLRALAWAARGVRTPARDTLLASITPRAAYGRAAGVERAGDNAGAIAGPLLAAVLVGALGLRTSIVLSFIPGLFAAAAIMVAARHARKVVTTPTGKATLSFNLRDLRTAGLFTLLLPVSFFELGNLASTLLILRATTVLEAGGDSAQSAVTAAILMYALHNAVAAGASLVGGMLIDSLSPRFVFTMGAAVYVLAYVLFALDSGGRTLLLCGFVLAGVGIGLVETTEQASVALLLPDRLRGNGYGVLGLVQSFGDLGATVVAGLLWTFFSPTVAFLYAAFWMVAAVLASPRVTRRSAPS